MKKTINSDGELVTLFIDGKPIATAKSYELKIKCLHEWLNCTIKEDGKAQRFICKECGKIKVKRVK